MNLLYAFPEPFPLPRARGVQVAHSLHALAALGVGVDFAYVPTGSADPFREYGLKRPETLRLHPLSRTLGWPLHRLPVHSNRLFFRRLKRWLQQAARPPQLAMARHLKLAAALLRDFPALPLLYEAHEVFADTAPPGRRAALRQMEETVVRGAALVIANSRATAARLAECYAPTRRIAVLPNGVNLPDPLPEKPWQAAQRHILYTGSFFDWKGADVLVAAGKHLPGFRITLIGGTPERIESLRRDTEPCGAETIFAGHLPHPETTTQLAAACIAVLPNRAAPDSAFTSPLKLFEYMAAGCAIVASDLPPLREILAPDEAAWVEPGNPVALAETLRQLAADPVQMRGMAEKARRKAESFTWEARAREQRRLIEEALHV